MPPPAAGRASSARSRSGRPGSASARPGPGRPAARRPDTRRSRVRTPKTGAVGFRVGRFGHLLRISMSLRVLIVDDSPPFRKAARVLLEARGYEVAGEADSAGAAFACVRALLPDAVLLDVDLPDGNGFSVCAGLMRCEPP